MEIEIEAQEEAKTVPVYFDGTYYCKAPNNSYAEEMWTEGEWAHYTANVCA